MTGRSPARLLAPLALVATAVALFGVVTSGGGEGDTGRTTGSPGPAATATPTPERRSKGRRARRYVVKPGDTPSGIAETTGVSLEALLEANPDVDPNALTPGQRLRLPRE